MSRLFVLSSSTAPLLTDLLDVIKLTEYSLRSGHALRTCASARCIRTATVSPLSPTAGRVRERERLCSGGLNSLV